MLRVSGAIEASSEEEEEEDDDDERECHPSRAHDPSHISNAHRDRVESTRRGRHAAIRSKSVIRFMRAGCIFPGEEGDTAARLNHAAPMLGPRNIHRRDATERPRERPTGRQRDRETDIQTERIERVERGSSFMALHPCSRRSDPCCAQEKPRQVIRGPSPLMLLHSHPSALLRRRTEQRRRKDRARVIRDAVVVAASVTHSPLYRHLHSHAECPKTDPSRVRQMLMERKSVS